jgi:hypothetical protein
MPNFWLVKTGTGASEVQNLPAGQKPLQANWGDAVYLGSTTASSKNIAAAAQRLGVPNPQNVPSLSTSLGITGAILGGFGAGAAAATSEAAGGVAAAAGAADTGTAVAGAAESGAAGTAGGIAGRALALSGIASLITSPLDFLKFIAWFFHPHNILRIVEGTIGMLLIWTGIWLLSKNLRSMSGQVGRSIATATPLGRGGRVIRKVRLPSAESNSE